MFALGGPEHSLFINLVPPTTIKEIVAAKISSYGAAMGKRWRRHANNFFSSLLAVVVWYALVKAVWNISILPTAHHTFRQYGGWEGMANVVISETTDKLKF